MTAIATATLSARESWAQGTGSLMGEITAALGPYKTLQGALPLLRVLNPQMPAM